MSCSTAANAQQDNPVPGRALPGLLCFGSSHFPGFSWLTWSRAAGQLARSVPCTAVAQVQLCLASHRCWIPNSLVSRQQRSCWGPTVEVTGKEGYLPFFLHHLPIPPPPPHHCLLCIWLCARWQSWAPRQRAWITNSLTVTLISCACHLILCL